MEKPPGDEPGGLFIGENVGRLGTEHEGNCNELHAQGHSETCGASNEYHGDFLSGLGETGTPFRIAIYAATARSTNARITIASAFFAIE
jgi:hypothetical protein